VFYAEFDIVVGPKVCFQSPQKFMHFDVDVTSEDVNHALEETFQSVAPKAEEKQQPAMGGEGAKHNHTGKRTNTKDNSSYDDDISQKDPDEYWNWSPNPKKAMIIEHEVSDMSSQITLPSSGHKDDRRNDDASLSNIVGTASGMEGGEEGESAGAKDLLSGKPSHERKKSGISVTDVADEPTKNDVTNTTVQSTHSRNPSFATHEGDTSTIDTELLQNSIFAATSEYIITGNELANQTITVSTHGMHILSRPMIICDTQRYERNSLLFAVGFVLRRNIDPRPYWPVLSNLSSTFRSMEVESEFLSHHRTRPQIQIVLEDILVSLNSKRKDCHLLLDNANLLNLHLFRPPPPPTPPVPDYAVPILLRPEWQLQMYDWDLTINWIVPHIDGCKFVKQIAVSTEVDMEMVRACLRVLRHHGVLAHVDVFRYSNVYECGKAGLFTGTTGKKAEEMKLLDAAFWYSAKAKYVRKAQQMYRAASNNRNSPNYMLNSPSNNMSRRLHPHMSTLHSLDLSVPASSTSSKRRSIKEDMSAPRSFPSRPEHITIKEDHSMDEDAPPDTTSKGATGDHCTNSSHSKEIDMMKKALAQLYSSCSRNESFGEMFLAKIEGKTDPSQKADHVGEQIVAKNFVDSTLTPLHEASEPESVASSEVKRENQSRRTKNDINWKLAFDYFDHRRVITYGVVHGLIRRVHQYPLAYEIGTDGDEANASCNERESVNSNVDKDDATDDFSNMDFSEPYMDEQEPYMDEQYHMPVEMSTIEEAAASAAKLALDERSRSTSYSASPLLQGISPLPLTSRDDVILNQFAQKELHLRSKKLLLERIALAMDGTRCDDELSCMFEVPIEKLVEMLQATGRWNVISLFSCTD